MIAKLLIEKKRDGLALSSDEIRALVDAYTCGDVPDYQMSAFAMAVCCRGMTDVETRALTEAMESSGRMLSWKDEKRPTADKHSTGGIGDKLSLVIQPLAASCGLAVPSLAGRGLGLTGGTVDKLESIPGFRTGLSVPELKRVVRRAGCAIAAQTVDLAPADRKLYALRDVTGTVPSIPLITASILSKKLAEGASTLVFDVKCGSGAFMKTLPAAKALAKSLVTISRAAGRKAAALVTAMDEPLGFAVGNANEVAEALAVLRGAAEPRDVIDLSVELAATMVHLAKGTPLLAARALCRRNLATGAALACFEKMVACQGGDLAKFEAEPRTNRSCICSPRAGYIASIDADAIARVAFALGAGRAKAGDPIDFAAGVNLLVHHGDKVAKGAPLCELCGKRIHDADLSVQARSAFRMTASKPPLQRLLFARL